jgi:hypothetical protein
MLIKFCPRCTTIDEQSERSESPDLPSPRTVTERSTPSHNLLTDETGVTDSRVTSTRTEDLHEIQQIFNEVNLAEIDQVPQEDFNDSPKSSPRKSIISSLFRKTLLRTRSRSTGILLSDADQLRRTKSDLQKTLFTGHSREAGGYDADAAVLDFEASFAPQSNNPPPERGRQKIRHGEEDWPQR